MSLFNATLLDRLRRQVSYSVKGAAIAEAIDEIVKLRRDLATATRLLRRAVDELRGWCSYDDAETWGFLEREKEE